MKDCRVRHLQIRSEDETAARHTAFLLEDALRTATLPGEQSRVIIVRALALGKLPRHTTSPQLALHIEHALQRLPNSLVHAAEPAAAQADAIYFRDDAEPVILLALHIARNEPMNQWFWPLAVKVWRPQMAAQEALNVLLRAVIKSSAGVAALARLIHTFMTAASIPQLFSVLRAEDGPALLYLCGWPSPPARPRQLFGDNGSTGSPQPNESLLTEWLVQWGADDARTQWLANLLLVMAQPSRLCTPDLSQHGRAWIEQIGAVTPLPIRRGQTGRPPRVVPLTDPMSAAVGSPPVALEQPQSGNLEGQTQVASVRSPPVVSDRPQPVPGRLSAPDQSTSPASVLKNREPAEQVYPPSKAAHRAPDDTVKPPARPTPPQPADPVLGQAVDAPAADSAAAKPLAWLTGELHETAYAGLFFLLPVLTRLDFYEWLQANPCWIDLELPRRILQAICQQLGATIDDPIWGAIAFAEPDLPEALPAFIPPASGTAFVDWLDGLPRVADTPLAAAVQHWVMALNAWCEQVLNLTIATVVQRTGWINMTPTHIDICFALQQTDLRIRRAGLDIDPGWVVWFGRVVLFHYEDG